MAEVDELSAKGLLKFVCKFADADASLVITGEYSGDTALAEKLRHARINRSVKYADGMTKQTGDKGIDGRIYFATKHGLTAMVLSVKGGKPRPTDVRDLRGVPADQPDTEMVEFLSLEAPSKAMLEAGPLAGHCEHDGIKYDPVHFLTL